ncbi:MAG TPA: 3-oxoacyl-ACP synthase, partial [Patescibacteria group bacterium]|nr:3-oxoacyl-ACP synthase [Patescibacteria group bacterium]
MTIRSVIAGCGSYLPEQIVTNADLEKRVDTTDEWIVQRTGIRERHLARDDEPTSVMATKAARAALAHAKLTTADIDGVIVATCTPDTT